MFLSTLFKRIIHSGRAIVIILIGVSIVCITSFVLMTLNVLGVFDPEIFPTSPLSNGLPTPSGPILPPNVDPFPRCIDPATATTAKVIEVVDGDTIKVLTDDGVATVRYIGIDTPELTKFQTKIGLAAQNKNYELTQQKMVTMYSDTTTADQYGRLLRYVFVDELWVNRELVLLGLAEEEPYEPDTHCRLNLANAELEAKNARLGIWQALDNANQSKIENLSIDVAAGNYRMGSVLITLVDVKKEYVELFNNSTADLDLQGWYLVSERGDQLCQLNTFLAKGETLKVFSQIGKDGYNCNISKPIWDNSSQDPAALYDPAGNLIDRR